MKLKDRSAIVTGAASGIGFAAACMFASEGARVVCADVTDSEPTVKEIEAAGGTARAFVMDVTDPSAWADLAQKTIVWSESIDVLANIAGVVARNELDTVTEIPEEEWDRVISVDLKGVWLGMRTVIPHMIQNGGGKIVNVASLAALRGLPNLAAYSAAKGGVAALTRQAAVEYAPHNVTINAISPGVINTPILGDITEEMLAEFTDHHVIKRLGSPDDIAAMMVHLLSAGGDFITGQNYPVDGGWSAS